jgi:hypothetical protein
MYSPLWIKWASLSRNNVSLDRSARGCIAGKQSTSVGIPAAWQRTGGKTAGATARVFLVTPAVLPPVLLSLLRQDVRQDAPQFLGRGC